MTEEELARWLATRKGFVSGIMRWEGQPLKLYKYQLESLGNDGTFSLETKARQTGFSFSCAAEGTADATLGLSPGSIFVSFNKDEAQEKIRYARALWEELPKQYKLRLLTDNKSELEFSNGRRLISHPCREPRGKPGFNIYLDELAHYKKAGDIYKAALPVLSRGRGARLRIGSTPRGRFGIFADIALEIHRKYPGYKRFWTFWWDCPVLTSHPLSEKEKVEAGGLPPEGGGPPTGGLPTQERVEKFGSLTLKELFEALPLEDFQQEFECSFSEEGLNLITWEQISAATDHEMEFFHAESADGFAAILPSLVAARKGTFYGGYDVGRRHDAGELVILDKVGPKSYLRGNVSLRGKPFEEQKKVIRDALDAGVMKLAMDQTGMGEQITEELVREYGAMRVHGIQFTGQIKETLASEVKREFDRANMVIPADRETQRQIHSIRRLLTTAGNLSFDSPRDEKGHSDRFWSLALAVHVACQREIAVLPVTMGAEPEKQRTSLLTGGIPVAMQRAEKNAR